MACCWRRSIYSKKRFIYYISGGLNQQENLVIRQTLTLSLFALVNLSLPAQAATDLDLGGIALQSDFRLLSEDLGAALSYKPLLPAEPLGVTGFDLGIEVTATKLEHAAIFDNAVTGDAPDTLYLPKLHVHKGLPFGFDIGASYAAVPDSNIKLWGAEVRYAILKGSTATPAVAGGGRQSAPQGGDQLKLTTTSGDPARSKDFALS